VCSGMKNPIAALKVAITSLGLVAVTLGVVANIWLIAMAMRVLNLVP
jgi:hypothetical protein